MEGVRVFLSISGSFLFNTRQDVARISEIFWGTPLSRWDSEKPVKHEVSIFAGAPEIAND